MFTGVKCAIKASDLEQKMLMRKHAEHVWSKELTETRTIGIDCDGRPAFVKITLMRFGPAENKIVFFQPASSNSTDEHLADWIAASFGVIPSRGPIDGCVAELEDVIRSSGFPVYWSDR